MALTRADGRLVNPGVFLTRADAVAGRVAADVDTLVVYHAGVECAYKRDGSGTALTMADSSTWAPLPGRPVFPEHFGAAGDGATDDTAEIQAAIDYLETQAGGVLHCTNSNYQVTSKVNIASDNIEIRGIGKGSLDATASHSSTPATVFTYAGASAVPVFDVDGGGTFIAGIKFTDIAIECGEQATIGIELKDAEQVILHNVNILAPTANGVLMHQSAATQSVQAAGFAEFDGVDVYMRNHTSSVNANGLNFGGTGSDAGTKITHVSIKRCRLTHQNGHGIVLGDSCDVFELGWLNIFRAGGDTGDSIHHEGNDTTSERGAFRIVGPISMEGAIHITAPTGITSNFLPSEGFDISGCYPFEFDSNLDDPRMGAEGTGRHLIRGRSNGFRVGLDRLWFGLEPLEMSSMRHMFNDFTNNRVHTTDFTWGAARSAGADAGVANRNGGGVELNTGATLNNTVAIYNTAAIGANGFTLAERPAALFQVEPLDTADIDIVVGMAGNNSMPPNDGVYFYVSTAIDNNWRAVCRASSTETSFDTGIDVTTAGLLTFAIVTDPIGVTFLYKPKNAFRQTWRFLTNCETNLPTGTTLSSFVKIRTKAAAAKRLDILRYELSEYLPDT